MPNGAIVILQNDDSGFNDWARRVAEHNRKNDSGPMVLVHIRELLPPRSRIARLEAELVGQPEPTDTRQAG